jgi:hypothetical protein
VTMVRLMARRLSRPLGKPAVPTAAAPTGQPLLELPPAGFDSNNRAVYG